MSKSKQLFIFLSLIIAIIHILWVTYHYFSARDILEQRLNDNSTNDYAIYQTIEASTYHGLAMQARFFSEDKKIQALFLEGKKALAQEGGYKGGAKTAVMRNHLYELLKQPWQNTTQQFDMRHFHFHLGPGAISYLRVHKPDKFGDRLDNLRFLIVDTNAEQVPKNGFETGRVSSALRSTAPIFSWDKDLNKKVYVGALEVSTSHKKMLSTIEQNMHIQTSILLNRQHIEKTVWDEFIDGQYNNKSISGCDCMLEASSNTQQKLFLEYLAKKTDFNSQILTVDQHAKVLSYKNHYYAVTFYPLRDYQGIKNSSRSNIGAIVMSRDIDSLIRSYKDKQLLSIIYGIIMYLILEVLLVFTFFKVIKHLNRQVKIQTQELSEQKQRIQLDKINYKNLANTINNNYFFYSRNNTHHFTSVSASIKTILDIYPDDFIKNTNLYLPKKTRSFFALKMDQPKKNELTFEIEINNKIGRQHYFMVTETVRYDTDSKIITIEGLAQDISNSRQESLLLKLRCQILQLISDKYPKQEILVTLSAGIEAIIYDIDCAIMIFNPNTHILSVAVATCLPDELINKLNNLDKQLISSENNFSCLIATETLKRKIIPDMQLFSDSKNSGELLKQRLYKASCSEPVLSSQANILGTVDFYYYQTGKPTDSDLKVLTVASDLVAKILE
ncbi:MAG: hypothetical protein KAI02_03805 [Gammaproteobacteria bacterium]|nr:hypothetical protein [Gammaproteobacteria bacterium]